jgi:hypothetical protein
LNPECSSTPIETGQFRISNFESRIISEFSGTNREKGAHRRGKSRSRYPGILQRRAWSEDSYF